jgi:uncharacterized membrane protein
MTHLTSESSSSTQDGANDVDTRWLSILRSATLLSITCATSALGVGLMSEELRTLAYVWQNFTPAGSTAQARLILSILGSAAVGGLILPLLQVVRRRDEELAERAASWVRMLLPLGPLALTPALLDWKLWQHHDEVFLTFTLLNALAMGAAVRACFATEIEKLLSPDLVEALRSWKERWAAHTREASAAGLLLKNGRAWLLLAACASAGYIIWFGYHTAVWHLSARSGYDLAIEDNILYNLLHGGPFFKAAPTLGPTGSHFGRHATLISYLLLPFYALHQSAETILILQSFLMGAAAIPLFLFARRRVGPATACLIACAYLLHPAVQQSNLFEAHYVKFGLPFVWALLWLLDSGRTRMAMLFAGLTLAVREDVAAWVVMIGLFAAYSGRSLRFGMLLTLSAGIYVVVIKLLVMPTFTGGEDSLMFMYRGLLPPGKSSYAWVLGTALSNPAFLLSTLLEDGKILYLMQLLVPLGLLPLRHRLGWFALLPGGVFCLLATKYPALTDIHFQYSPHFIAFLFPALVIALEGPSGDQARRDPTFRQARAARAGHLALLVMALLPSSYQYGAVLQGNTSRGGPLPYSFGWDSTGRARQAAIKKLQAILPKDARVAASAYLVPQISARPSGYSLSLGLYDADWIFAPSDLPEFITPEISRTREALRSGEWGVVAIEGPFFLAKKGHDRALNAKILNNIGRSRDPRGKRPIGKVGDTKP